MAPIGAARANLSRVPSFIPDSGLLHRYDARELSGFSDGDTVNTLPDLKASDDLSGSATYRPSGFNGNAALEFNPADNDTLQTTFTSAVTGQYHVFVVGNVNPTGGDEALIEAETPGPRVYDPDFNSTGSWYLATGNGNLENVSYSGQSNDLITLEFEDGDSAFRVNGTDLERGDANGPQDLDGLTVAERKDQNDHLEMTGGEIWVVDPTDPDYSRGDVEQYLADEWGITI